VQSYTVITATYEVWLLPKKDVLYPVRETKPRNYGYRTSESDFSTFIDCKRTLTNISIVHRHNTAYTETQTFSGHKSFVTCVCVVPANDLFPQGLIVTGGNDKIILAFTPESSDPVFQLKGHENTGILDL